MRCCQIVDHEGRFNVQLEVHGRVLESAVRHGDAEDVLRCAFLLALSVLIEDGPWPEAALQLMAGFMDDMRGRLLHPQH